MSQAKLAQAAGTSQSAIARIESAQENITLDTLERLVVALDGNFLVSIAPQEFGIPNRTPWWEANQCEWVVRRIVAERSAGMDRMVIGVERTNQTLSASTTPNMNALLAASTAGSY